MPNAADALLCRYRYDPLDRLAGREDTGQGSGQCFYQKSRLTTEIQGQERRSWLQTPLQLLAQRRSTADISVTALIATDIQGSVLHGLEATQPQAYAYSAYGSRDPTLDLLHLPGFNRERADPVTGHYLLGNGYRAFNPVLMRFNSPDSASPFGRGGLNAYAYCTGDPVNRVDPSGHWPVPFKFSFKGLFKPRAQRQATKVLASFDSQAKPVPPMRRDSFSFDPSHIGGEEPHGYILDYEEIKALGKITDFTRHYDDLKLRNLTGSRSERLVPGAFEEQIASGYREPARTRMLEQHIVHSFKAERLEYAKHVFLNSGHYNNLKYLSYLEIMGHTRLHSDLAEAASLLRQLHGRGNLYWRYGGYEQGRGPDMPF